MVKIGITIFFILCCPAFCMEDDHISAEYRISLGSSGSFSNLLIARPSIQLIVSPSLLKLLHSHHTGSKAIIKIIDETSRQLDCKKDEILNKIVARAKEIPLSDAIQDMQSSKDCETNRSRKIIDKLSKNSANINVFDEYIPEAIRKHVHFLINLATCKGKKDLIYEWLFKLSDEHIWTIKIFPIKSKQCCFTSVDVFASIRNYEHVLFLDAPDYL